MFKYLRMLDMFKQAKKKGYSKNKSASIAIYAENFIKKHHGE